jgi:hypothetical protein
MGEEQVRQAIRKDFPGAATTLSSTVHSSEKTTILPLTATDLRPYIGKACISYILGHHSKKLIHLNILWSRSCGRATTAPPLTRRSLPEHRHGPQCGAT